MMVRRRGFTLIELVVVIAIFGVLTGLTLAAVHQVRQGALRGRCLNNLRNQALAVHHYESMHGRLPPGAAQGPFAPGGVPDGASHGLWAFLLRQLDRPDLAGRYHLNRSHDHPDNAAAAAAPLTVLRCPGQPPPAPEAAEAGPGAGADYGPIEVNPFLADIGLIDPASNFDGALPVNGTISLADIRDGTSQTLLVAEAGGRPGVAWCSPTILLGVRQVFPGGGGPHRGGTCAAMADGSARFLSDRIDLRLLARLATRDGGEPVGDDF
jgi:prepilin-type N-terminal cleavage/methylation domain-containing protein